MSTLGKFPKQYPLIHRFTANTKDIVSLLSLEANGTATVGNSFSLSSGTVPLNHTYYGVVGKCLEMNTTSSTDESSYYRDSDSTWSWAINKTWMCFFRIGTAQAFTGTLMSHNKSDGSTDWAIATANYVDIGSQVTSTGDSVVIAMSSDSNWVNISDQKFHHVAWVEGTTSDHRLYVDGVLHDASTSNIGSVQTGGRCQLGADAYSGGVSGFNGRIDEVAVFTRAWTTKQMRMFGGGILP